MHDQSTRPWRLGLSVLLILVLVFGVGLSGTLLAWFQLMFFGYSIDGSGGAVILGELLWPAVFLVGPLATLLIALIEIWRFGPLTSIPYTWSVSTLLACAALVLVAAASTTGEPDPYLVSRLLILSHTLLGSALITEPFARLIAPRPAPPRPRGVRALLGLVLRAVLLVLVLIAAWMT